VRRRDRISSAFCSIYVGSETEFRCCASNPNEFHSNTGVSGGGLESFAHRIRVGSLLMWSYAQSSID
jgi:hypothetical protein